MEESRFYRFFRPLIPKPLRPLALKYQAVLSYLFFGVLTTLVMLVRCGLMEAWVLIVILCRELADLGFDEIMFSYLQMPNTSAELSYAAQLSTEPTARDAVMSLAQYLRTALADRHVELSVIISADAALQNAGDGIGQDLTLFAKIFSRVCAFADGDTMPALKEQLTAAAEDFNLETRFVPFVRNAQIEGSWVMTG